MSTGKFKKVREKKQQQNIFMKKKIYKYTVPKAFSRLKIFQNTPRKFPRFGRCYVGGVEWGHTFRDLGSALVGGHKFRYMRGAVSRYGGCCVGGWGA